MLRNIGTIIFSNLNRNVLTDSCRSITVLKDRMSLYESKKKCKWDMYNNVVYPPQSPEEPQRPGFICHKKEFDHYSYKKMWYVASFIRGMSIEEALKQLQFVKMKGSVYAIETLLEAQQLAVEEHNFEFKTNMWVSESFVGKRKPTIGMRRHRGGRIYKLKKGNITYYVTLEEGKPPEHYYYFKRPKTGKEMFDEWMNEMRQRKVLYSI